MRSDARDSRKRHLSSEGLAEGMRSASRRGKEVGTARGARFGAIGEDSSAASMVSFTELIHTAKVYLDACDRAEAGVEALRLRSCCLMLP